VPFLPFALHLADGRRIAVRHPSTIVVSPKTVTVGLPPHRLSTSLELARVETVPITAVARVEPLSYPPFQIP
jgi:hypothetical protein